MINLFKFQLIRSYIFRKFPVNELNHLSSYKIVNCYTRCLGHLGNSSQSLKNPENNCLLKMDNELSNEDVIYLETPEKSENDKNFYRLIQLKNGIKALLIEDTSPVPETDSSDEDDSEVSTTSDETTTDDDDDNDEESESLSTESATDSSDSSDEGDPKLAAIALMVNVGSFSDPPDINGLAHFLEHMIFMGSEKYPSENEFDSFIKKCGGFDNAETECEETIFYFEIPESHLDPSLDRFVSLFVSPLMKKEAMTRERDAVESEFQSSTQDDEMRRDQLLASLGNPDHPCSNFTWGNLKTLKDNISDDELYNRVHDFKKQHYSATRMFICIQARLPLDEIEELIVKHFSQIPNNEVTTRDLSLYTHENAFRDEFYSNVYFVKPVDNICKLEITWVFPPLANEYRYKPHDYLSYLLGYEGRGSLCAYLRRRLWAHEMLAGVDGSGFDYNSMYSLFNICIFLTEEGFNHLNEVLQATFAYIKLLEKNGPNKELYTQIQEIEATTFRFRAERSAFDKVQELVVNLKYYPPKDVLTGPILYFEYNEESINKLIKILNTRQFNLMLTSLKKYNGIAYDKKEKWFGTEYACIKTPQDWIYLWDNCPSIPELYFPTENKFVTKDFQIFCAEGEKFQQYPKKLLHNDICELWFRQDDKFLLPECCMYFHFITPLPLQSPKNAVLLTIYSLLVKYRLVEELYPATTAGLDYNLQAVEKGLILKVYGYNEKLHLIVDVITKGMTNIHENLTEAELEAFVKQQKVNYYNYFIKPKNLNRDIRLNILETPRWSVNEKYNFLKNITLSDFKEFSRQFLKQLKIQALIQGNLTEEKAHNVMNMILNNLQCSGINDMSLVNLRSRQIPNGSNYVICKSFNQDDTNTVVSNLYQWGIGTKHLRCVLYLVTTLAEEPAFDTLRTKEQLAYHVSVDKRYTNGIIGYTITVNSQESKFPAEYIEERIEEFRKQMFQIITDIDNEDFEHIRESLIRNELIADNELKDEVDRNWCEIISEEYMFDRRKIESEEIKKITKFELLELLKNMEQDDNFRKLSIQVVGNKYASPETKTTDRNDIESTYELIYMHENKSTIKSIDEFKKNLYIFSCAKELELNDDDDDKGPQIISNDDSI